jgi:glycosyltransferase involved in cell wall biosynthesis
MDNFIIYTENFTYSGSEKIIENIYESNGIKKKYNVCVYYALNKEYEKGIKHRFGNDINIKPLGIINPFTKWGYYLLPGSKLTRFKYSYYLVCNIIVHCFNIIGIIDAINCYKLYRLFNKEKPKLVLINNGGYPGARSCRMAVIGAKLAGISNSVFVVNNLASPTKGVVDRILDKYINRYVSTFVTASQRAMNQLILARRFDRRKCINIPNTLSIKQEQVSKTSAGILREELKVDEETVLLGSVGLLTYRKGFHVLIDSIKYLHKKCCVPFKYKLMIFGEGEERGKLQELILLNNLQDIIFLPGYRSDIIEYMKDFDLFILPSVANEDFPYVIIEAMLLEKPVIGTDIAGIPEQVLDGYNGYVVPSNDSLKLGHAIERLILDRDLMKLMGYNSYIRYINNFSNGIIVEKYLSLFSSLTD